MARLKASLLAGVMVASPAYAFDQQYEGWRLHVPEDKAPIYLSEMSKPSNNSTIGVVMFCSSGNRAIVVGPFMGPDAAIISYSCDSSTSLPMSAHQNQGLHIASQSEYSIAIR